MYSTVLTIHCVWAYATLLTLIIAVANAFIGLSSNRVATQNDRRLSLFALIAAHLQFVFGLVLYFVSPNGIQKIQALGMGGMSAMDRLLALEHPLINLIGVVLITIGWSKYKKAAEDKKLKPIAIFYGIGLVLFLSRLPWQNWFA